MDVCVGIDVAKEFHWVRSIGRERSEVLLDRRVENTPADLAGLVSELEWLEAEHGRVRVGVDVVGGIAALVTAMLLEAGFGVVHVPGLAVNRARQGTTGGKHKSDPRGAGVIADQVRVRSDLRAVEQGSELDAEIRLLVGRRRELVTDQTRPVSRLRDLLASVHPGLERVVDPVQKSSQQLLRRYVTPAEIGKAGERRIANHVLKAGQIPRRVADSLAAAAVASARKQRIALPGGAVAARILRELADDAWKTRERILKLDRELAALLERHPDAALIRSLPGMGVTLTAEFIAEAGPIQRFATPDQLAAAAGLAPVLKQSGKVRYLTRASGGNKTLKRVFFQSAFRSLQHPPSNAFYARKRAQRKTHHQAVITLARQRVDVLHATPQRREPYRLPPAKAA